MLTNDQQQKLGLRKPTEGTGKVEGLPSPVCTWLGGSAVDYNAQIIPAEAIVSARLPGATVTQINGFGAVQNVPAETMTGSQLCQVAIDAGPGQTIRVQALTRTDPPPIPMDQVCQHATEAASMVMTTVVATASR